MAMLTYQPSEDDADIEYVFPPADEPDFKGVTNRKYATARDVYYPMANLVMLQNQLSAASAQYSFDNFV